jgi:DNA replication and repair protein RecF
MERVQLVELTLRDFRNIASARLEPGARFNVIAGRNGMGKTNLLEAIYLLGALRSFRTTVRGELVRKGAENALVAGVFGGATVGLRCEVSLGERQRRVRVDDQPVATGGGHFQTLPMVLFQPGNMELVQGGPGARRRFLDRALFQAEVTYPSAQRDYGRALASRNRLLKERRADRQAITAFDTQLVRHGARIAEQRARFVERLAPRFVEAAAEIGDAEAAQIEYRPRVAGGAAELADALEQALPRDLERGHTSVGPHTDDLELELDGRSARRFASQGQQRTLVLALKIAETRTLADACGRLPLLLLDDVSSELDRERNRRLMGFLDGVGGQVFITTTHLEHILFEHDRVDFAVTDGRVEPNALGGP